MSAQGRVLTACAISLLLGPLASASASAPRGEVERTGVWTAGAGSALERTQSTATSAPFLTLLYSRTQMTSSLNCTPLPKAVPLTTVASELRSRGLRGTGTIVTRRIGEASRVCLDDVDVDGKVRRPGGVLYASWSDAASLRDTFGWRFVSHSKTYRNMTDLTPAEVTDETCGSLADFRAHGHFRADGLFAYPNNRRTVTMQRDIVSRCFEYGRVYGAGVNEQGLMTAPWFQKTMSVNGGNCNAPALPCYNFTAPRRYFSPVELATAVADLLPGQWFVLQSYRFVTGSAARQWDCTSPDWRDHWTSSAEEYCWSDHVEVLKNVRPGTRVTDPKTVGIAWGR